MKELSGFPVSSGRTSRIVSIGQTRQTFATSLFTSSQRRTKRNVLCHCKIEVNFFPRDIIRYIYANVRNIFIIIQVNFSSIEGIEIHAEHREATSEERQIFID